jgi:hypothetical protein
VHLLHCRMREDERLELIEKCANLTRHDLSIPLRPAAL